MPSVDERRLWQKLFKASQQQLQKRVRVRLFRIQSHTRECYRTKVFLPPPRSIDDGNVCILSLKNSTIFTARATFVLLPAFSSSFSVCRRCRHGVRELSPLPCTSFIAPSSRVCCEEEKLSSVYNLLQHKHFLSNSKSSWFRGDATDERERVLGGKMGANRSRYDAFLTLDCILNFLLSFARRESCSCIF